MKSFRLFLVTLLCGASIMFGAKPAGRIPAGAKIYIAPMEGGLDGFIAPEILKKHIPVVVVTQEADAEYVLSGQSLKADDHWYNTVFGGKDKNEGNVRLLSIKDRTMVWAGEAGDRSLWWGNLKRGGQRKVADRIAQQMKKDLF
jgi:hypothetical protein